ncbi:MAG: sugar ABC transporter substrate-binding protein [Nocardioidaceae bacterium]
MKHRRTSAAVGGGLALVLSLAACGNGFSSGNKTGAPQSQSGPVTLNMIIASSGDAETNAVTSAVKAWEAKTGNTVKITPSSDIQTDLAKSFASSSPADLMYIDAGTFATYASQGALYPYAQTESFAGDVYPSLKQTFTYNGKYYCVPKDFSTLGLIINTDMWKQAGLTNADIPKTWDQLDAVAKKLTTSSHVGLSISPTRDRVGAFMVQSGGWLVNADGTQATADSTANVTALSYVKKLLDQGVMKWSSDLDTGWGGEAFGTGKAAMTIEGNWIDGAMKSDYPKVHYQVAPLPSGPAGSGTLLFTQCWGVSSKSPAQQQAIDLIKALTTGKQELSNAKAFGVMPALPSVKSQYQQQNPQDAAFITAAAQGKGPISLPGFAAVLSDFDSQLAGLAKADPTTILASVQKNALAALTK